MGTLKPQSNGSLQQHGDWYTLAVDGWVGTARRGLGGLLTKGLTSNNLKMVQDDATCNGRAVISRMANGTIMTLTDPDVKVTPLFDADTDIVTMEYL